MNEVKIAIIVGKILQNVIIICLVCVCVCVCVCGWRCLKLLTEGFVRCRTDLKLSNLVKCKIIYVQDLLVTD
jgi:hypothetical protein